MLNCLFFETRQHYNYYTVFNFNILHKLYVRFNTNLNNSIMVLIRSNTEISLFIFKKITSGCTKYEEQIFRVYFKYRNHSSTNLYCPRS
jgi:hypothetical protein